LKKLFSVVSIFILAFTTVGCDEISQTADEIATLQEDLQDKLDEVNVLLEDLSTLQESVEEYEEIVLDLEAQIAALQAQIYDNVITVTFDDGNGNYSSGTVGFNDDFDGTLLELLEEEFDVQYTTSEYGAFINGIEGITTMAGNFISFGKNGEASMVGVDTATFTNGDVFSFELTWWDTGLEAVYNGINLFMDNHISDYVNSTSADYAVVAALSILGVLDDYITPSEMEALIDTSSLSTNTDYFKAIIRLNAVGSDTNSLYDTFAGIATTGSYGGTAYGLIAMNSTENTADFGPFELVALESYETESPFDLGLDSGGITMVALSEYAGDTDVDTMISEFATWITTDQLPSGGIMTRDLGWGSSENAASISAVILGLVANGIDPRGVNYTQGENNLVTRLLEFQTETGSFDWVLTDEVPEDLAFSTPQAFLALVVYQQYVNTMSAVNPYSFE
jgi:hypothetical protein